MAGYYQYGGGYPPNQQSPSNMNYNAYSPPTGYESQQQYSPAGNGMYGMEPTTPVLDQNQMNYFWNSVQNGNIPDSFTTAPPHPQSYAPPQQQPMPQQYNNYGAQPPYHQPYQPAPSAPYNISQDVNMSNAPQQYGQAGEEDEDDYAPTEIVQQPRSAGKGKSQKAPASNQAASQPQRINPFKPQSVYEVDPASKMSKPSVAKLPAPQAQPNIALREKARDAIKDFHDHGIGYHQLAQEPVFQAADVGRLRGLFADYKIPQEPTKAPSPLKVASTPLKDTSGERLAQLRQMLGSAGFDIDDETLASLVKKSPAPAPPAPTAVPLDGGVTLPGLGTPSISQPTAAPTMQPPSRSASAGTPVAGSSATRDSYLAKLAAIRKKDAPASAGASAAKPSSAEALKQPDSAAATPSRRPPQLNRDVLQKKMQAQREAQAKAAAQSMRPNGRPAMPERTESMSTINYESGQDTAESGEVTTTPSGNEDMDESEEGEVFESPAQAQTPQKQAMEARPTAARPEPAAPSSTASPNTLKRPASSAFGAQPWPKRSWDNAASRTHAPPPPAVEEPEPLVIDISSDEWDEDDEMDEDEGSYGHPGPSNVSRAAPPWLVRPSNPSSAQATPPVASTPDPASAARQEEKLRRQALLSEKKAALQEKIRLQELQKRQIAEGSVTVPSNAAAAASSMLKSDRSSIPRSSVGALATSHAGLARGPSATRQAAMDALDAGMQTDQAQLQALQAQMEQIKQDIARKAAEKQALAEALEEQGVDTEGMSHAEMMQARIDIIASQHQVEQNTDRKGDDAAGEEESEDGRADDVEMDISSDDDGEIQELEPAQQPSSEKGTGKHLRPCAMRMTNVRTDSPTLRSMIMPYGPTHVIPPPKGKKSGHKNDAFVLFKSREAAEHARDALKGIRIGPHKVNTMVLADFKKLQFTDQYAVRQPPQTGDNTVIEEGEEPDHEPIPAQSGSSAVPWPSGNGDDIPEADDPRALESSSRVRILNTPWPLSKATVQKFLGNYDITGISIPTPSGKSMAKGKPKGHVLIDFLYPAEAQQAVADLNSTDLEGIKVSLHIVTLGKNAGSASKSASKSVSKTPAPLPKPSVFTPAPAPAPPAEEDQGAKENIGEDEDDDDSSHMDIDDDEDSDADADESSSDEGEIDEGDVEDGEADELQAQGYDEGSEDAIDVDLPDASDPNSLAQGRKIAFADLPPEVTKADVYNVLANYGVNGISILRDPKTLKGLGIGFADMKNTEAASKAIADFGGKPLWGDRSSMQILGAKKTAVPATSGASMDAAVDAVAPQSQPLDNQDEDEGEIDASDDDAMHESDEDEDSSDEDGEDVIEDQASQLLDQAVANDDTGSSSTESDVDDEETMQQNALEGGVSLEDIEDVPMDEDGADSTDSSDSEVSDVDEPSDDDEGSTELPTEQATLPTAEEVDHEASDTDSDIDADAELLNEQIEAEQHVEREAPPVVTVLAAEHVPAPVSAPEPATHAESSADDDDDDDLYEEDAAQADGEADAEGEDDDEYDPDFEAALEEALVADSPDAPEAIGEVEKPTGDVMQPDRGSEGSGIPGVQLAGMQIEGDEAEDADADGQVFEAAFPSSSLPRRPRSRHDNSDSKYHITAKRSNRPDQRYRSTSARPLGTPEPTPSPAPSQPAVTKPSAFKPYTSALRGFKAYRLAPGHSEDVKGGIKSLSYSNKTDHQQPLCAQELKSGSCTNANCPAQHFRDMALQDTDIIKTFSVVDQKVHGKDAQAKWNNGLIELVGEIRKEGITDNEAIAQRVAKYRRSFFGESIFEGSSQAREELAQASEEGEISA